MKEETQLANSKNETLQIAPHIQRKGKDFKCEEFGELAQILEFAFGEGSVAEWSVCPGLKSGDPEFKSRSDHQLDLFQVVLGSTPWLRLYIAN